MVGLIGRGEAGGFYSTCKGEWLEGVKQRRDMMQFIKTSYCLLCAEWALEGSRGKTELGGQLREMMWSRAETMGVGV